MDEQTHSSGHSGGLALLFGALIVAGILLGASGALPTGNVVKEAGQGGMDKASWTSRVMITPLSTRSLTMAVQIPGINVRHEFGQTFSADVSIDSLPALKLLAKVEPVDVFSLHQIILQDEPTDILGSAVEAMCGDKICQPSEAKTCPEDCAAMSLRTCVPTVQKPYNVELAQGGQPGLGEGVTVAVIDTGATASHLDLKQRIKSCVDTTGLGTANGCADTDTSGHGTHVSAMAGADGGEDGLGFIGVAPSVNIMAIKACASATCYADDVAEAIQYAASKNVQIIVLPFGSPLPSEIVKSLIEKNPQILFIASSGNDGPKGDTIQYPAADPAVLAVGAIDPKESVTWFSSRGVNDLNDKLVTGHEIELVAGGLNIEAPTNNGCYSKMSGTSMSAGAVAGIAAAVWDRADGKVDGKGDAVSTRRYMISHAKEIAKADGDGSEEGFDIASGYGEAVIS